MSAFETLKNAIYSMVTRVKSYKVTDDDLVNTNHAEYYINELIRNNIKIIESNNALKNYLDKKGAVEAVSYFYAKQVLDLVDRREFLMEKATSFLDELMNYESRNISEAATELTVIAEKKFKEQGREIEVLDLEEELDKGLFFTGKQEDHFEKLKNDKILYNKESESEIDKNFFKYYNAYIMQDIYFGMYHVLISLFEYVDFKDDEVQFMDTFKDIPVYIQRLNWLPHVNKGTSFAIDKGLVDNIFNAYDKSLNKTLNSLGIKPNGKNALSYKQDVEELKPYKIFEYQAGYLRNRAVVTNEQFSIGDNNRVLMSAVDLTTLIEFGLEIEEIKPVVEDLIKYFVSDIKSVPINFADSAYIKKYLTEDVKVYDEEERVVDLTSSEIKSTAKQPIIITNAEEAKSALEKYEKLNNNGEDVKSSTTTSDGMGD